MGSLTTRKDWPPKRTEFRRWEWKLVLVEGKWVKKLCDRNREEAR